MKVQLVLPARAMSPVSRPSVSWLVNHPPSGLVPYLYLYLYLCFLELVNVYHPPTGLVLFLFGLGCCLFLPCLCNNLYSLRSIPTLACDRIASAGCHNVAIFVCFRDYRAPSLCLLIFFSLPFLSWIFWLNCSIAAWCRIIIIWEQWRLKYTEVQPQQMDFTQSPSGVSSNPRISTYNLILAVIIIFIILRFVVLSSFLFAWGQS